MRTILATLHSKYIHASLALPCLAAYCGPACGEIAIREFTVHEPREAILAALLQEEPAVVGFSVYLWNRRESFDLIDALAAARPDLRLVVGGPEVSFDGAELFARHPGLTALVRGEGEEPLRALLAAWAKGSEPGQVPRLTWRRGPTLVEGPDGPPLAELDAIPSPFRAGLVALDRGLVYLETSRGCPFRCCFLPERPRRAGAQLLPGTGPGRPGRPDGAGGAPGQAGGSHLQQRPAPRPGDLRLHPGAQPVDPLPLRDRRPPAG
jgi:anaerobic magnesium-protoporphyrin IX monomethyl ester cyclase